mmetsp:Transcript_28447/g.27254  ORF Transcript_28447/g.27254 Transcript_28447/m.27254 type:complete len:309 (-) Transcript_28447:534-1460(-)
MTNIQTGDNQIDIRLFMEAWKETWIYRIRARGMLAIRNLQIKRKVYEAFHMNIWRSLRYRALQAAMNTRRILTMYTSWIQYVKWCRRFNAVYQKSNKNWALFFFSKLRYHTDTCDITRAFRRNVALLYYRVVFRCIQTSILLDRFRIYRHVKYKCIKTYKQKYFYEKYLFKKWHRYYKLSLSISHLDVLRELVIVKEFFNRWNCNKNDNDYGNDLDINDRAISSVDLLALAMENVDENDESSVLSEKSHTTVLSDPKIIKNPIHEQYKKIKKMRQQKKDELISMEIEQNLIRRKRILNALNYQNPSIK